MRKIIILLIFFSALFFVLIQAKLTKKIKTGKQESNKSGISVVLTGFGSKNVIGKWTGEIAPLVETLDNPQNISGKIGMCESVLEGDLYGQRVIVASSGMAKVKTTACLMDILQNYKGNVKEVIFAGIAGITPMKGGMLNDSGDLRKSEPAMLGDICVNDVAFDFDLQHYTSDQSNSASPQPLFWPQKSVFSSQFTKGDADLTQELYSAALEVVWPASPQNVKDINNLYHEVSREPRVWSPDECLEATSDLYWHDIESDRKARDIAAKYLNQANNGSVKPEDLLIVTSMEALPSGVLVNWWNKNNETNIAFAYVRVASNFDHTYLNADGTPGRSGLESVEQLRESGVSRYAIENAALPVLQMFKKRSIKI